MSNDLNELQQIELNMLKIILKICFKHELRYYALGGTLLGAARHKGFIPWDDDIDIAMPRPDFDRFISLAENELTSTLEVHTYTNNLCQVYKMDSEVLWTNAEVPRHMHIWIDIFPLDAMPSTSVLRIIQKYNLLYHRMRIQFSMYEENAHKHRTNRPLHEKLLMKFREMTKFGSNWDTETEFEKTERALKRYSYEKENYCVNLMGAYKFKEMFPKDWIGEGVELPFEDITINCPTKWEQVLNQMYGDWHTPPAEAERPKHHCITIINTGGGITAE